MTSLVEKIKVTAEFSTLSLMIWRRFRRPMPGLLEDTLARNPGLAELGHFLPVGTEFDLKIETPGEQAQQVRDQIRLW